MKRLLLLSILALFVTSSTGCLWGQPWWRRGAPCGDPCGGMTSYGSGMGGYEMSYPPATTTVPNLLPGPVQTLPPG